MWIKICLNISKNAIYASGSVIPKTPASFEQANLFPIISRDKWNLTQPFLERVRQVDCLIIKHQIGLYSEFVYIWANKRSRIKLRADSTGSILISSTSHQAPPSTSTSHSHSPSPSPSRCQTPPRPKTRLSPTSPSNRSPRSWKRTTSSRTSPSKVGRLHPTPPQLRADHNHPDWPQEEAEQASGTANGTNEHLWEESWDDDDAAEDFSKQLK